MNELYTRHENQVFLNDKTKFIINSQKVENQHTKAALMILEHSIILAEENKQSFTSDAVHEAIDCLLALAKSLHLRKLKKEYIKKYRDLYERGLL